MKKNSKVLFFVSILSVTLCSSVSYASSNSRDELVAQQLNCVSQQLNEGQTVGWGDICYSKDQYDGHQSRDQKIDDALEQQERGHVARGTTTTAKTLPANTQEKWTSQPKDVERETAPRESYTKPLNEPAPQKKSLLAGSLSRRKSPQKFDFGFETYYFRYHEPGVSVKSTGEFFGGYSSYTIRISENQPVKSISDILSDVNKVNMFRIEGRFATGKVDYDGTGTFNNISDYTMELRALAGYDVPMNDHARFTPFAGLGYRYLFDNFSAVPAQTINGVNYVSGYDREQQYIYLPLGVEYENQFSSAWTIGGTLEYDALLQGQNKSHLEDSVDSGGNNAGGSTLRFIQRTGRGLRASIKLIRETENIDFTAEPFVRYWRIENSTVDSGYLEPTNNTREFGIKLGLRY